jgi:hypothetical protein
VKPTEQQAAIVAVAKTGAHLVIEAGAGTGKTSTLKLLARAKPNDKGVYLAYNRSIATDAAKSFPSTVVCKTAHSFAFASVGRLYSDRLGAPRQPARVTAQLLGINSPLVLGDDVPKLAPQQIARIVMATVDRFCQSADAEIVRRHVPLVAAFEAPAARAALAQEIVPIARRAWEDITHLRGRLRFTHDCYLKIWQLSEPDLRADYVLLDEAQDSNPAVAAVVSGQRAQRILVGDRCQAIYGWRGAVDAMQSFDGQRLYLSQSFRFGPAIADEANKWLGLLDAELRLTGYAAIDSTVQPLGTPDAILCRSNGGTLEHVMGAQSGGRRVALVGGGREWRGYAEAAQQLLRGEPCNHPELVAFSSWAEVQDYVDQDAGGTDLKVIVKLIDKHGPVAILDVTQRLVDENEAQLIVSTAHKAKGREWETVRIADDFREPRPDPQTGEAKIRPEDAMLAYVSITRAQNVLDRDGLAWVDNWVLAPTMRAALVDPTPVNVALALHDYGPGADRPASPPAPGALHAGECRGLCDDTFPDRCLWPEPLPAGVR